MYGNNFVDSLEAFNQDVASFEQTEVEKLNTDFNQFEELISNYNLQLDSIREEFKNIQNIQTSIQKLSLNIVKWEKHLVSLKLSYMGMEMQQKHELKKEKIQ